MIKGRPPSISVAVVIMFLIFDFFVLYKRNIEGHYGGYKLLLTTDVKVNLSIKVNLKKVRVMCHVLSLCKNKERRGCQWGASFDGWRLFFSNFDGCRLNFRAFDG